MLGSALSNIRSRSGASWPARNGSLFVALAFTQHDANPPVSEIASSSIVMDCAIKCHSFPAFTIISRGGLLNKTRTATPLRSEQTVGTHVHSHPDSAGQRAAGIPASLTPGRSDIILPGERNNPLKLQFVEGVIEDRARGL
jgi:hypothetical protein